MREKLCYAHCQLSCNHYVHTTQSPIPYMHQGAMHVLWQTRVFSGALHGAMHVPATTSTRPVRKAATQAPNRETRQGWGNA